MALQWLPITGFCMIEDDLRILDMTASHSQDLHNVMSGSAIGKPQWRMTLFCNRLDFNQQAGGRCHLLRSVANREEATSLKRCLLRVCL